METVTQEEEKSQEVKPRLFKRTSKEQLLKLGQKAVNQISKTSNRVNIDFMLNTKTPSPTCISMTYFGEGENKNCSVTLYEFCTYEENQKKLKMAITAIRNNSLECFSEIDKLSRDGKL